MRMHCLPLILALGVFELASPTAVADEAKSGFLERVYKDANGKEYKYVLFVPHEYQKEKESPLILFLHGSGEREGGTKAPVEVGLGPAIKKLGEKEFPFFVLFPQFGKSGNWEADGPDARRALAILDETRRNYSIDSHRLDLTGLSTGGRGTWSLAMNHPDLWAAIVPLCGWGDVKQAEEIKGIPCWCFHGDKDNAVKVEKSREMIAALTAAGSEPKYDEYPGVGHNCWDKAYGTKELYDWLLKQSLK